MNLAAVAVERGCMIASGKERVDASGWVPWVRCYDDAQPRASRPDRDSHPQHQTSVRCIHEHTEITECMYKRGGASTPSRILCGLANPRRLGVCCTAKLTVVLMLLMLFNIACLHHVLTLGNRFVATTNQCLFIIYC